MVDIYRWDAIGEEWHRRNWSPREPERHVEVEGMDSRMALQEKRPGLGAIVEVGSAIECVKREVLRPCHESFSKLRIEDPALGPEAADETDHVIETGLLSTNWTRNTFNILDLRHLRSISDRKAFLNVNLSLLLFLPYSLGHILA